MDRTAGLAVTIIGIISSSIIIIMMMMVVMILQMVGDHDAGYHIQGLRVNAFPSSHGRSGGSSFP